MSTTALEITCAKPGCHWKGPPGDAPSHDCPTPAADGGPFEGLETIAGPSKGEPVVEPPDQDADPETRADIEEWLLAHGAYDDAGVPQDEKTARLDAQLSVILNEEDEDDGEPDLDDEPLETPAEPAEPEPAAEPNAAEEIGLDLGVEGLETLNPAAVLEELAGPPPPREWETIITDALAEQTGVKEYRWLVVLKGDGDAELLGRAKVKTEATELRDRVAAENTIEGELVIVKTADVLAAAAEIEKRRELVEEPDRTIESEPAPEPGEEPETPPEPATPAEPPPAAATGKGKQTLFDAGDYEREDLRLPKVDGHPIDRIAVDISGTVMLDRSNPDDVALWRRMKLGVEVELWVTAKGMGFSGKGATNKEGDLDVVVGRRSVSVTTLRIIPPEGLEAAGEELAAQAADAHEAGEDVLEDDDA